MAKAPPQAEAAAEAPVVKSKKPLFLILGIEVEIIKLHLPQVRSRLLLLLSSQKASDILTPDGKNNLAKEIIAQVNKPFEAKAAPQSVTGVFFTSFVIQ
jgi:flagellar FliL protein